MAQMKWFRLYSEILHDRKLARIARHEQYPLYQLIGVWVSVLCIANEAPDRGKLMLGKTIPMTEEDIAFELGMSVADLQHLFQAFIEYEMVHHDGNHFCITSWSKRQFKSDDSYERVKRYREKQSEQDETFLKRFSNALDTDTDTDTEKSISTVPVNEYIKILQKWENIFPEKPHPRKENKTLQGKTKTRLRALHFKENWEAAMGQAGKSKFLQNSSWFTLQWFLKNDDNYEKCLNGNYDDGSPSDNGTGSGATSKQDKANQLITIVKKTGGPYWTQAEPMLKEAGLLPAVKRMGGWSEICRMKETDIPFRYYEAVK